MKLLKAVETALICKDLRPQRMSLVTEYVLLSLFTSLSGCGLSICWGVLPWHRTRKEAPINHKLTLQHDKQAPCLYTPIMIGSLIGSRCSVTEHWLVQYQIRSLRVWAWIFYNLISKTVRADPSLLFRTNHKTLTVTQQWQMIHLHKYSNLGKLLNHIMCITKTSGTWEKDPELASKGTISLLHRWADLLVHSKSCNSHLLLYQIVPSAHQVSL